ncbi:hypothetical protein QQF64_021490 [Cirrhinus molitorella]|uniref:Uncharacterized protein n=1 Tax=Cirrhinus molitorella TaxID=172907 RepID=A0ABR3L929_9TELE
MCCLIIRGVLFSFDRVFSKASRTSARRCCFFIRFYLLVLNEAEGAVQNDNVTRESPDLQGISDAGFLRADLTIDSGVSLGVIREIGISGGDCGGIWAGLEFL